MTCGSRKKRSTSRAMISPMPSISHSSSTNASGVAAAAAAARNADSVPYFAAIGFASSLPTLEMPSADSRREKVAARFASAIAATSFAADVAREPLEPLRDPAPSA